MKSGIYKITNLINNKIYIGSSSNINERINAHFRCNGQGSIPLSNAILKYGKDNFEIEILEYCNRENLKDIEQKWMDYTKCYDKNIGYNILKTAATISVTYKGRTGKDHPLYGKTGNQSAVSKEVFVYDLTGKYYGKYISLTEASKQLNISLCLISECCRKTRHHAGNYMFRSNYETQIEKYSDPRFKKVEVHNLNDNSIIIYDSMNIAAKGLSMSKGLLQYYIRIKKQYKQKTYKYINNE